MEEIAFRNPKAKEVKVGQFFEAKLVKELDQSGFIDSLYR